MNRDEWKSTLLSPEVTIQQVIETIDQNFYKIALVVDSEMHLLGTITDGDVRRGLLKGLSLDQPAQSVIQPEPMVALEGESSSQILLKMQNAYLRHIPIVNTSNQVVSIETIHNILNSKMKTNWVMLMSGGLGERLRPLTDDCPKPLLKVGYKPLLETIIENFTEHGFFNFFLSVNYKAEMISDYFGDGSSRGVQIQYIHESQRMGTAGALTLLPEEPKEPIIVMNADLLTKVNFEHLLDFHLQQQADATMCVREYKTKIPYGVVELDHQHITNIREKPSYQHYVNAGIYVLSPHVLSMIPQNTFYDMPQLFTQLLQNASYTTNAFPIREYWLDIGHHEDFQQANVEYSQTFGDTSL